MHLRITEKKELIEDFSQKKWPVWTPAPAGDTWLPSAMATASETLVGIKSWKFFGEFWSADVWRFSGGH